MGEPWYLESSSGADHEKSEIMDAWRALIPVTAADVS